MCHHLSVVRLLTVKRDGIVTAHPPSFFPPLYFFATRTFAIEIMDKEPLVQVATAHTNDMDNAEDPLDALQDAQSIRMVCSLMWGNVRRCALHQLELGTIPTDGI